ncbi:MAG: ribonuclease III [Gammaproteobacteria bacterium]|nr:ribonuclease III [Gammaproteobacteria bacterium]
MTHRSVGSANYERLEFLGDALLGFLVGELLFEAFPEASEGQLTRLRASLVKRETLAAIARELDLGAYLHLGPGELKSGGHQRDSILSDVLEAIICAVYQDGGMAPARVLVENLFTARVAGLDPSLPGKDPKTCLQELLQARGLPLPVYELLDVVGESPDQVFRVACFADGLESALQASGSSRRRAEQIAAAAVLEKIQ